MEIIPSVKALANWPACGEEIRASEREFSSETELTVKVFNFEIITNMNMNNYKNIPVYHENGAKNRNLNFKRSKRLK